MKMKWALNSATIMNSTWDEELVLWEKYGWSAAEIWYSKIEPKIAAGATYDQLVRQMGDAGVKPIGICAAAVSTPGSSPDRAAEKDAIAKRLDTAVALGVPALTVITLGTLGDNLAAEYDGLIDPLRDVAELAAERGMRINLEFLGGEAINGTLGSGIELVNRVNHPSLGLLFDLCHYYVGASHIEEINQLDAGKLFVIHVDDAPKVPMERLRNDERCFPGEGRIDVPGLIKYLQVNTGFNDYLTMELYAPEMWKLPADETMTRLAKSVQYIEEKLEELN